MGTPPKFWGPHVTELQDQIRPVLDKVLGSSQIRPDSRVKTRLDQLMLTDFFLCYCGLQVYIVTHSCAVSDPKKVL